MMMRSIPVGAALLLAAPLLVACAQPAPPPPVAAAPAAIHVQTPIAPRLLPGTTPPVASPADQAAAQMQRLNRADTEAARLRAVDPRRPMQFGEPQPSERTGDQGVPEIPDERARIFQRR